MICAHFRVAMSIEDQRRPVRIDARLNVYLHGEPVDSAGALTGSRSSRSSNQHFYRLGSEILQNLARPGRNDMFIKGPRTLGMVCDTSN